MDKLWKVVDILNIKIIGVGKLKEKYFKAGIAEYAKRLGLIWFVVSFCLACALSIESSSVLSVIAVAINFCASSIALEIYGQVLIREE